MSADRAIHRDEFRQRLEEATQHALVPNEGVFGPNSVSWHLLRESLGMLGGGRAALLQTAHPWVANGVDIHSKTKTDPLGRFHRTFENVFTIIFGSLDQVIAVSQQLNDVHSGIVGKVPEATGKYPAMSRFFANHVDAMLWVHATLWETYMKMRELVLGPLDRHTKELFYQEIKRFALCFGVPLDAQPPTWPEFLEYNERMWDSQELGVGRAALDIRGYLFRFDLFPGSRAVLEFAEVFTAETMPPRLREAYRLPKPSVRNKLVYESGLAAVRAAYPRMPARLRYLPAYFEANDRLAGRAHSGIVTRKMNRFWVGREELVSRDAWA